MGIQPEPSPKQEQVKVMSSETSPNQLGHGAVPVAPTQPKQMPCLCVSKCKTSSRKRQVKTVLHFMLLLHLKFTLTLIRIDFLKSFILCHSRFSHLPQPVAPVQYPPAEPQEQGAAAEGQIHPHLHSCSAAPRAHQLHSGAPPQETTSNNFSAPALQPMPSLC